jgi:hypothetical protein
LGQVLHESATVPQLRPAVESGPNGVVAVGRNEFWAGDGDSTVKAVDLRTKKVIANISTGGKKRADEIAYDARDHLVIAVNNADDPPFVTFISTRTRKVVGRLELRRASDGAEQPVGNPASGLVYVSIPSLDGVKARGAVAIIDPRTYRLVRFMPVAKCMPAGLDLGPHDELLLGCSDDAIAAGFPARSFVMSREERCARARSPPARRPRTMSSRTARGANSHHSIPTPESVSRTT